MVRMSDVSHVTSSSNNHVVHLYVAVYMFLKIIRVRVETCLMNCTWVFFVDILRAQVSCIVALGGF